MEIQSQEKVINEHTIKVRPFVGSRSNKMLVRLQQCLDGRQIMCSPDVWQQFCIEFLAFTFVDGKEIGNISNFDSVFAGNLMLLFLAIEFTSEVNFGKDFFMQGASTGNTNQSQAPTM